MSDSTQSTEVKVTEQVLTDVSTQVLDSAKIDSLKQLVGIPLAALDSNTPQSDSGATTTIIDPMAKLQALKEAGAVKDTIIGETLDNPEGKVKPEVVEEKTVEPVNASEKDQKDDTSVQGIKPIEFKEFVETLENTKVLHKIDGQIVEIDLKDALKKSINEYAGHQTVEKRFKELDFLKQEVYHVKQAQEQVIQNFNKFREAGDILGGYEYIGSLTGTPPYIIKEQLVAALAPEIERRYSLSQQDLEYEQLLQEKEYLAQKVESESRQRKQEQAQRELTATVTRLKETHGIDDKLWESTLSKLDKTLPADMAITPEMVVEHAKSELVEKQLISKVNSVAKKYNLEGPDLKVLSDIAKQYPTFSEEDIDSLVKESLIEQSKQETEKKLASKYADKKQTNAPEQVDNSKEIERLKRLVGVIPPWS